jgi:mono/diheme cytochrome c family protein
MNKIFKAIASISGVAVLGLIFGSCSSNPDSAGLEYMPDMYRSPAIEPYVDYGEVKGSLDISKTLKISALVPPMRTIPYYGTNEEDVLMLLPYHRLPNAVFAKTHGYYGWDFTSNNEMDYEYLQAAADVNPYKITAENAEKMFEKGKELYTANCMHCHGEKGDGNGPMVTAGSYVGAANLGGLTIAEGQMFYSIYYGRNAMGGHASMVNKKEIWTLVHYIHKFQNPAYGTFDEKGLPMGATAAAVADTTVKM